MNPELALQDELGLVFWPCREVASLTPERARWRAVHASGAVAHRPTPPPAGEWVPLGDSLVSPRWMRAAGGGWIDPAGFAYHGQLPVGAEEVEESPVEGLPCLPHQVQWLEGVAGMATWHTDLGSFEAGMYASQAAALHPHLVPAGRGAYVNRQRLRRILNERKRFRLVLDNGFSRTISYGPHLALAEALGLPQLYQLEPCQEGLYREGLRCYPYDLLSAPEEPLRRDFPLARRLIANCLWQTVEQFTHGVPKEYNEEYRGYWYELKLTLFRAGFLTRAQLHRADNGLLWKLYQEVVGTLVGADRLFTFSELGFTDPRPDLRHIGTSRPHILLVAEKASLKSYVTRATREVGCSSLVLGGLPSLLSSEFCARALREAGVERVVVWALVDYDPFGWIAARALAEQLQRFGLTCLEVRFLMDASCFSAEELRDLSLPIASNNPQVAGKVRAWVAETGGVLGEARGIAADLWRPFERLLARMQEFLGAISGSETLD